MKTIYSELHQLHDAGKEFYGGEFVACFEKPARAGMILAEVNRRRLGEVSSPQEFGIAPIMRVHGAAYIEFLEHAWRDWTQSGFAVNLLPSCSPSRGMRQDRVPADVHGRACYFSFDVTTPITSGSWQAAKASAEVALTAQSLVVHGEKSAFALCRPPGHHASIDYYGGYCFLNNAAIAAQALRDGGAASVAILDLDYHHGNGTQSIFYDRSDVYFASLHGDPAGNYPYFLGYADETGAGSGQGCNANYPLPAGTGAETWFEALRASFTGIRRFKPEALVISLGVDTYEGDPICHFRLESDDFLRVGEAVASLGLPSVFVMEGGYAVESLGINVVNVLAGFEQKLV